MTACICVMNKNSIALAADSAVTIGKKLAIRETVNKLFSISRVAPVGVLVYSNAQLMQIPVEIVLKQFRRSLNRDILGSLTDYSSRFLDFLIKEKDYFRFPLNEEGYIDNVNVNLGVELSQVIEFLYDRKAEELKRPLENSELLELYAASIAFLKRYVHDLPDVSENSFSAIVKEKYSSKISDYLTNTYEWLTPEFKSDLEDIILEYYNKASDGCDHVGIAFAGFGENEIFPTMVHMSVYGIIDGKVRYRIIETRTVDETHSVFITPLAQKDVMQTFLFGINDRFLQHLSNEIPNTLNNDIEHLDESWFARDKKDKVKETLSASVETILDATIRKAQNDYYNPILRAVASLPIDDLAMLAESMVSITSFRRKVAFDDNFGTVGGPIDVAVISKGDGLIWTKRKHYFDGKENPQYFFNNYERVD